MPPDETGGLPDDHLPITRLRNLGSVSMRQLAEIGVANIGDLRVLGSVIAYASLKLRFPRTSLNALYAIEAGLRGVHWQRVTPDEKTVLRKAAIEAIASARKRGGF